MAAISSINAFPKIKELNSAIINFDSQNHLSWGIYWSVVSLLAILIILIWLFPKNEKN
jgi:hypothetical protein